MAKGKIIEYLVEGFSSLGNVLNVFNPFLEISKNDNSLYRERLENIREYYNKDKERFLPESFYEKSKD